MKTLAIISLSSLLLASAANSAVTVTQWTFEGSVTTPASGAGTSSNVGSTSSAFATGNGGGIGWNTSSYPAQSTGSGTAGVQFLVPTTGFEGITISFDHRASGTASRWAQLDYTLDGGTTWTTGFWNNGGGLSPHDTFYSFSVDMTSIIGADNNADFGFRIVSIFSPLEFQQNSTSGNIAANTAYMRANADAVFSPSSGSGTGNYGGGGTWRFDNVTITAAIPEPTTALLGVLGLLGFLRRRR